MIDRGRRHMLAARRNPLDDRHGPTSFPPNLVYLNLRWPIGPQDQHTARTSPNNGQDTCARRNVCRIRCCATSRRDATFALMKHIVGTFAPRVKCDAQRNAIRCAFRDRHDDSGVHDRATTRGRWLLQEAAALGPPAAAPWHHAQAGLPLLVNVACMDQCRRSEGEGDSPVKWRSGGGCGSGGVERTPAAK